MPIQVSFLSGKLLLSIWIKLEFYFINSSSFFFEAYPDLLAFLITILLTMMLAIGVRESTRFNSLFTGVNLLVVLFVIVYGALKVDIRNWNLSEAEVNGR